MSWNFDFTGLPDKMAAIDAVAREEVTNKHFPPQLSAVVMTAINALPNMEDAGIAVSSDGHFNAVGNCHMRIFVATNLKPTPDRNRNGHDREDGHGAKHESGLPEGSSKPCP